MSKKIKSSYRYNFIIHTLCSAIIDFIAYGSIKINFDISVSDK